jgi:hypothetical protein
VKTSALTAKPHVVLSRECAAAALAFFISTAISPRVSLAAPQAPAAATNQPAPHRTTSSGFREPDPIDFDDHAGYVQIFDGATLKDWDGDPSIWRVENSAIVGESTKEKPVGNSYIAYRGYEGKDFDLKLEIKVEAAEAASSTAAKRGCPGAVNVLGSLLPISTG